MSIVAEPWEPLSSTTTEEAVLLAPLDIVSARGRARPLFGFDYVWEVYKPAHQRRFGYYTLPILWGDRLVARLDPKLDRESSTLMILGFWPEGDFEAENPAFLLALGRGLARFADSVGAARVDLSPVSPQGLRNSLSSSVATHLGTFR